MKELTRLVMNSLEISLISSHVDRLMYSSTLLPSDRWTLLAGVRNAATNGPRHSETSVNVTSRNLRRATKTIKVL